MTKHNMAVLKKIWDTQTPEQNFRDYLSVTDGLDIQKGNLEFTVKAIRIFHAAFVLSCENVRAKEALRVLKKLGFKVNK